MIIAMVLLIRMKNDERWNGAFKAMGTDIEIDLVGSAKQSEIMAQSIQDIQAFFEKMEQIFSRFRSTSELSQVNEHKGSYVTVSSDFIAVMELAMMFHDKTRGIFDPRIYDALINAGYDRDFHTHNLDKSHVKIMINSSSQRELLRDDIIIDRDAQMIMARRNIDLSGIVKGWAVDRVRDMIPESLVGWVIDAGGDMWVQGITEHHVPWYIGIEGIEDEKIVLHVDGEGIATSGTTRRQWQINGKKYHHLISPEDMTQFSFDIDTVTVIAPSAVEADVWAKTIFLMGREKGLVFAESHGIKVIIIDHNYNIYVSQHAQKNIIT